MAVYRGVYTPAAGAMLTVFDTELVKNANWSIYDDSVGTNRKCYECAGGNTFYVDIDDNYAGYYKIQLWTSWDDINHIGDGDSTTVLYHGKDGDCYTILLNDTRFIVVDDGYGAFNQSRCRYVGYTRSVVPSAGRYVVVCGGSSTTYDSQNHLGTDSSTGNYWRALGDPAGGSDTSVYIVGRSDGSDCAYRVHRDRDGFYHLRETLVYAYGATPRYCMGFLEGVCLEGYHNDRIPPWDDIICDGTTWRYFADSSYGLWLRMI